MAVDDTGKHFAPSPDPMLEAAGTYVAGFELSEAPKDLSGLDQLLKNEKVFGVDLVEIGMADLVKKYFLELSGGIGAVRDTLERYVDQGA